MASPWEWGWGGCRAHPVPPRLLGAGHSRETPSVSAKGAASSLREGALGFCSADPPARVAPAKRGAGRFDALQNPRSNQLRAEKSFRLRRSFRRAPVLRVPTSFTLLDRARPVFSFSSGRKGENGGCIAPAIAGCQASPPARASKRPLPRRGGKKRKRAGLPASPEPYCLEDWMKRSFVSCKY